MNLIHALRDAEARFTGYGQCMRCHRSWRRAEHVTVWWRTGSGTFLLCGPCWQVTRRKADAGLILQGYAARHLDRYGDSHGAEERREILAAFGVAHRYPMEVSTAWDDGSWSYDVRVAEPWIDVNLGRMAEHRALGERMPTPSPDPDVPEGEPQYRGQVWGEAPDPDGPIGKDEWVELIHVYCGREHLPGDCPADAPGWNGAGSNTVNGDMEANRG